MTLGEAAVEGGDFEHALNLFNRVESSHAAWNEAQVMLILLRQCLGKHDKYYYYPFNAQSLLAQTKLQDR